MVRESHRAGLWRPPCACAICGATFQRLMSAHEDRPADVCLECHEGARAPAPEAECPRCQGDRLVEWDALLRVFVCDTCSHQWRPRLVVAVRDDHASGAVAPRE